VTGTAEPESGPASAGSEGPPVGVLVLGMHRSGTSAATRLVNLIGPSVCIPSDLLMGTSNNVKGFWESNSLIRANDGLLGDVGATWWHPPSLDVLGQWEATLDDTTVAEARRAFARVHPTEPWVWKDPRTCLTLGFWRRCLARPVAGIVVYRNPLDTARSLERRNTMNQDFASALWMRYTRLLLEQAGGMPLLVSAYERLLDDPVGWSEATRGFLDGLGMGVVPAVDVAAAREFVDPTLRHNARQSPVQGVTAELYDVLRSLDGAHPSFVVPGLGVEPAWIDEQFAAVGPAWHPSWRDPATAPPAFRDRLRARWRRTSFLNPRATPGNRRRPTS
jgi:hypothetical protein